MNPDEEIYDVRGLDAVINARCGFRGLRTPVPIDGGQRSDDRGQPLPSTVSWGHGAGFASRPDCLAANFRMLSPFKIRRWALCTSRSRMASAMVGLPISSCQ